MEREELICGLCEDHYIDMISHEDVLLHQVHHIRLGYGDIYTKFTPFYNRAIQLTVGKPLKKTPSNFFNHNDRMFEMNRGKLLTDDDMGRIKKNLIYHPRFFLSERKKKHL